MPKIRGLNNNGENAPFVQYDQLFNLYPYLPDRNIFRCPSVNEETSTRRYPANDPVASRYTVYKTDDRYIRAYREGWWPDVFPTDYPGLLVEPLYTEYWMNDWTSSATINGRPVPGVNGGILDRIPFPSMAVIMTDGVWEFRGLTRHNGSNNFLFVDAHVEPIKQDRYYDWTPASSGYLKQDIDAYGNRPFYAWGLTNEGINGASD